MICDISGQQLAFSERIIVIANSQRAAVEAVLLSCGCKGEWSSAVSGVETYSDSGRGSNVAAWTMFLESKENAMTVQCALDAVD